MKTGRTLTELAQELDRQSKAKKDWVAPTNLMHFEPTDEGRVAMQLQGVEDFGITETAHNQTAKQAGINRTYYNRMLELAPALLCTNVNHWLTNFPERRMIRTLDGNFRALRSDKYRTIDNDVVAETLFKAVQQMDIEVQIQSCEVTERRLYIKITSPKVEGEAKVGDPVQAGVSIRNSEIGYGFYELQPLVFTLRCLNGMILPMSAGRGIKQIHATGAFGDPNNDRLVQYYESDTLRAKNQALLLESRDVVRGFLNPANFSQLVDRLRETTEHPIRGDVEAAVEVTAEMFSLTQGESDSVLNHLAAGGDLTQYGLLNAVTETSQGLESYDRATELEEIGGKILELKSHQWRRIEEARKVA